MMRRYLTTTAAVACIAGTTSVASGFSWFQAGGFDVVWFGNESIRALSPTTFPPGSEIESFFLASMGLWNIVPSTNFTYAYGTLSEEVPPQVDGLNITAAVATADLDPGVLGVTYLVNDGPFWLDMDMVFPDVPDNIGWNFESNPDCDSVSFPETFGFNFLIVAVHELGHALGLGHEPIGNEAPGTFWFIGTMNPRYPSGGPVGRENIIELWTDDRNGLRYLYPPSGPSQPPYRDIANAGYTASTLIGMAIPSIFWPSTAPPDSTITARAGIQNFGNTSELFVDFGFYLSTDDIIDGSDFFLGSLEFDLAFQDALDFDVDIDIPEDLAAGPYYLISRIDDLDEITEEFEDNNEVVYCEQLIIEQLPPAFQSLGQETTDEGVPYAGPTPVLAKPLNMAPITWTLDAGPPGMTIDASTGVLAWDDPVTSEFLYAITVRATNDAGTSTGLFFLGVQAPPAPTCPGDVDGDDATNLVDFTVLAMSFGASGLPHGNGESRSLGDLNDDGSVDLTDFTILALDFGCAP